MVRTRSNTVAASGILSGTVFQHPILLEFVGQGRYLQMAVSKAVARIYVDKFGAITAKDLSYIAAKNGHLLLLRWTREIGCDWCHVIVLRAVESGHAAVMQWLLDIGEAKPNDSSPFSFAVQAQAPNLHTLEWLYKNKFAWSYYTCMMAARTGWLEGLQFLRAKGCPWNYETRLIAVKYGHLDVYKWAHRSGCPGSHEQTSQTAATKG